MMMYALAFDVTMNVEVRLSKPYDLRRQTGLQQRPALLPFQGPAEVGF